MANFMVRMFALDTESLTLVIMICGWGFMIMRMMVSIPGLAIAAFPLLVLSALAANVLLRESNFVASLDRGAALGFSTGVGMIAALIVIVAIVRLAMSLTEGAPPRAQ